MKNMKLYNEMTTAMAEIIEAENAVADWKKETNRRKKVLNTLIATAKKIDPAANEYDNASIITALREEFAPVEASDPDEYLHREVADAE